MPILDEDLDTVEQTSDEIAKSRGKYYRIPVLPIKAEGDDSDHFIRFISDRVVAGQVHKFTHTKDEPEEFDGSNWPKMIPYTMCQNDKAFRLRQEGNPKVLLDEFEDGYGNCWICTNMKGDMDPQYNYDRSVPTYLTFGLAVLREPVRDGRSGKVSHFKDQTVEHTVWTGEGKDAVSEIVTIPRLVIIGERYDTVWHPVNASAFTADGTYLDKDFRVQRKGKKAGDWKVAAVHTTTGKHDPSTASWGVYAETLSLLNFNLRDWFLATATPDHYKRWFIPGAVPEGGYKRNKDAEAEADDAGSSSSTAGDSAVDEEALADFEGAMRRGGSK